MREPGVKCSRQQGQQVPSSADVRGTARRPVQLECSVRWGGAESYQTSLAVVRT